MNTTYSYLLYIFLKAQIEESTLWYWVSQVLEDIEEININLELDQIRSMKKLNIQKHNKRSIYNKGLFKLDKKKKKYITKSLKGKLIKYDKMAEYLTSTEKKIYQEKSKNLSSNAE